MLSLLFLVSSCFSHFCLHFYGSTFTLPRSREFKQSFVIDKSASKYSGAYPKVETWKLQGGRADDCCYWDGIECDNSTGHVIGLDLSSSCLHGSIDSTSSLFHLVHLHTLNLADNNFSYSQIPSSLGNLSKLIYLNLSYSVFSGPIPSEISKLSKLISLDLSSMSAQLALETTIFRRLVQNLTSLEVLHFRRVYIASSVPDILANLSSLTSLSLTSCLLYGEFPPAIFQLPNLQFLDLTENWDLAGHLPEFNVSSPLLSLILARTSFAGEIPNSIVNLLSLEEFDTMQSGFSGMIPASLGNLTQLNLLRLWGYSLEVSHISFLSWIRKLTKLTILGLYGFCLNSEIPSYIANLTQLNALSLPNCQLTGEIPAWLLNMTQLTTLDLQANNLHRPIPSSIFQLRSLESLSLAANNFNGTVELDMFLKLPQLTELYLSGNQLSVRAKVNSNTTIRKFVSLGLGDCNLSQFPDFLRDQDELQFLDLSHNNIHGPLPRWLWSISKDTLLFMNLSGNFLTNVGHFIELIAWVRLNALSLIDNMLQGSLPIPPPTIKIYSVSGNNFSGEVPSTFCGLKSLIALDLSHNNLSGVLPQCLGNLSNSLEVLNLGGNKFQGKILSTPQKDCNLKMLKLRQNHLEGRLSNSLANCARLEFLDVGKNQIEDLFPAWLGPLRELKVLILRSNKFHGGLGDYQANFSNQFPMLRIIDLSQNNFSGRLPAQYLLNWKAMKLVDADHLSYMQTSIDFLVGNIKTTLTYSMSITNKGVERECSKILEYFVAIDLSGNKFEGEIPELIRSLQGLRMLNLSDNILNDSIPSSLGNLTKLESLDLSRNKLSGEIPQQLIQLGFLAVFDVSYNNLIGPIPGGKQFDTFDNSSYKGNSGLCGNPLSRKCGNSETLPLSHSGFEEGEEWGSSFPFGWKPVVMGYACGLLVGLVIGLIVTTWKYDWFLRTFRVRSSRRTRHRGHRN